MVHVAVAANRAEAYLLPEVEHLVVYDLFRDGLVTEGKNRGAIFFSGCLTFGVSAGDAFTVPYAFVLRRNMVFAGRTGTFTPADASIACFWKLPFAMLFGNLLALLFLVPVLLVKKEKVSNRTLVGSSPSTG